MLHGVSWSNHRALPREQVLWAGAGGWAVLRIEIILNFKSALYTAASKNKVITHFYMHGKFY